MMSMRTLAACGLLFVAAPAWAGESLVAGQPLQYNHPYPCKGERIIVAHCRDEDDSSYCQTVYPDRPFVNGNQVAPIEMRGDVVAKLNACNQAASAPAQAPAPAPAAKSSYAKASKAPGLGDASWLMLGYNKEQATYFTKAGIKRTGTTAEGWFTTVYAEGYADPSAGISGVEFLQARFRADCTKGTVATLEGAYFNDDGELIDGSVIPKPVAKTPKAGTVGDEQLNVMCGKPQKLMSSTPFDVDGLGLVFMYKELLDRDARD